MVIVPSTFTLVYWFVSDIFLRRCSRLMTGWLNTSKCVKHIESCCETAGGCWILQLFLVLRPHRWKQPYPLMCLMFGREIEQLLVWIHNVHTSGLEHLTCFFGAPFLYILPSLHGRKEMVSKQTTLDSLCGCQVASLWEKLRPGHLIKVHNHVYIKSVVQKGSYTVKKLHPLIANFLGVVYYQRCPYLRLSKVFVLRMCGVHRARCVGEAEFRWLEIPWFSLFPKGHFLRWFGGFHLPNLLNVPSIWSVNCKW